MYPLIKALLAEQLLFQLVYRIREQVGSLILMWQPVKEKENTEFKLVKLKKDLV